MGLTKGVCHKGMSTDGSKKAEAHHRSSRSPVFGEPLSPLSFHYLGPMEGLEVRGVSVAGESLMNPMMAEIAWLLPPTP